jgi:apolipoprotein N-acyltransferase
VPWGRVSGWRDRAARLAALSGWRRAAVLILLGILATLTLPPLNWVPLLWVSFAGLALMLDGARSRWTAFGTGFWFGWAHHAAGIYWITYALLVDPAKFGWMIPFAVLGLGAVLAIFVGLATLIAREIAPPGLGRVLALAAAWAFTEWVRGWIFTGFPWNLIATAWVGTLPIAQFASLTGAFGLSLLSVLVTAMPATLVHRNRIGPAATAAGVVLLMIVAAWGWARVPDAPMPTVPDVRLRLVQASIPQQEKWAPANRTHELIEHIQLSLKPGFGTITDVVWPETATPYFIEQDPTARAAVARAAPPDGLVITGAPRATLPDEKPYQVWNSLEAVDGSADIVASYDKVHLVPFGEYMPLRKYLPLDKITAGSVDFSSGTGLRTLDLPGLPPVSPLICYEGIFPGAVVDPAHRPQWLLNITNDGWFGLSAGPYQHFAASRMRAIEEGLPLVRDGNTGITAFVDPYGRVISRLPLGAVGVLDGDLPQALPGLTFFARFGNAIALVLMALVALAAWMTGRRLGYPRAPR